MTTSFTVAPSDVLIALIASSGTDRNAKRRCDVIGALNGVFGATSDGAGPSCSPSGTLARPAFITAPSGPRRFALAWFAAFTSTGLRVALPSSRTVRVVSSAARPGLRTSDIDARTIISPSLGTRSPCHADVGGSIQSPSGSLSSISVSSSAPDAPSIVA